jgi:uncharacterized protein
MNTLIDRIKEQYRLDWHGTHGWPHWVNVNRAGQQIALYHGLNANVIQLFSVFHDACRENELDDEGHGKRGAELAFKLRGDFPILRDLSQQDFDSLYVACAEHTDGTITSHQIIGACWDADRLDLGRVGITPNARYLSTDAGRSLARGLLTLVN